MPVTPASRSELLRVLRHTEERLHFIITMLPDHSKVVRLRLGQLANRLARVLGREATNPAGDD